MLGAEDDVNENLVPVKGHFYTGFIWGWCYDTTAIYDFDDVVLFPVSCGQGYCSVCPEP